MGVYFRADTESFRSPWSGALSPKGLRLSALLGLALFLAPFLALCSSAAWAEEVQAPRSLRKFKNKVQTPTLRTPGLPNLGTHYTEVSSASEPKEGSEGGGASLPCATQACLLRFGVGSIVAIQSRVGQSFSAFGSWEPTAPLGGGWTLGPSLLLTAFNYQNSARLAWVSDLKLSVGYLGEGMAPLGVEFRAGAVSWIGEGLSGSFGFEISARDILEWGPVNGLGFRYDFWGIEGRATHVIALVFGIQAAAAPKNAEVQP